MHVLATSYGQRPSTFIASVPLDELDQDQLRAVDLAALDAFTREQRAAQESQAALAEARGKLNAAMGR